MCRCDCGTMKVVNSSALRSGKTRSCGCLRRDVTTARSTKHGLMTRAGRHPTYYSWSNMIRRTTDSGHPRWKDWGGRGITVCDRWREYPNFLADMGLKPDGATLERLDNDKGYEPGNCIWASPAVQNRNKRSTRLTEASILEIWELQDQGLPIAAIAERVGLNRHVVGTVCTTLAVMLWVTAP